MSRQPPRKWRIAGRWDDGLTPYQCLFCKGRFDMGAGSPEGEGRFCPLCGVEWEGQHESDTEKPVYATPLRGREEKIYTTWILERRFSYESDVGEWNPHPERGSYGYYCRREALEAMRYEVKRDEEDGLPWRNEYRLVLKKGDRINLP